jgi:hypothetical protein
VKSDIKNPRGRWNRVLGRAAWFLAGALLAVVGLYIGVALNRPQLSPWHDFAPDGEFRARSAARVQSFDDYLPRRAD